MTEQLNFFEQIAAKQMVAAHKAKLRAADKRAARKRGEYTSDKDAPRVPTPSEKAVLEAYAELRQYKRWKRSLIRAQLMGPEKNNWRALTRVLRQLTIDDSEPLLHHIRSANWLLTADLDTRHVALSIIAAAIVRLRLVNGYEPFEDSMPFTDEAPTVFEIVRKILVGKRHE